MHPTSGYWATWHEKTPNRDGYYRRRWYEGRRPNRKQREQLEHRWLWEEAYGPIPAGYDIHHRDGNKLNNTLENLELVAHQAHAQHHGALRRRERPEGPWCRDCSQLRVSAHHREVCQPRRNARARAQYASQRGGMVRQYTRRAA